MLQSPTYHCQWPLSVPSIFFLLVHIFLCLDTSSTENHAICSAFLFAYNSHEDIVLSPDDIWLMICIYFSQYINENAEQLRTLFVDHNGRKRLTIEQIGLVEPEWVCPILKVKKTRIITVFVVGTIFSNVCEWK
jgi:hypothetical protein